MDEEPVKEKKEPEELTCPEWMMTMGDCMSLLLTFFVLLLTFSTTSKSKLMDVIGVMKGAFSFMKAEMVKDETAYNENSFDDDEQRHIYNPPESTSMRLSTNSVMRWQRKINENLSEVGFKHPLNVKRLEEGLVIEVAVEDIFFENSSKLTFKGTKFLNEVAALSKNVINEVRIMHFLDKSTVNRSRFNKEWNHAVEQNLSLARDLKNTFNLDGSRFSSAVHIISGSTSAQAFNKIRVTIMEKLDAENQELSQFLKDLN